MLPHHGQFLEPPFRLWRSGTAVQRISYFACAIERTAIRPKDMALEKAVPVM